ncbi:MAG TPA: hypothetical protein P5079_11490, partial [Elusimicrobiota bacterium]|nr:hypothetical protein [Elusimicrobiota bacterium]
FSNPCASHVSFSPTNSSHEDRSSAREEFVGEKETWLAHGFEKIRFDYESRMEQLLGNVWSAAESLVGRFPAPPPVPAVSAACRVPSVPSNPLGLTDKSVRAWKASPRRGEAFLRRRLAAVLSSAAGEWEGFLRSREAQLRALADEFGRQSRRAHELADRAVKAALRRQADTEAAAVRRENDLRSALHAAVALREEIASFRRSLEAAG